MAESAMVMRKAPDAAPTIAPRATERHSALEQRFASERHAEHGRLLARRAASSPSAAAAGVVQRYALEKAGKVSHGRALLLAGARDLYAGEQQFAQADQVGGDVVYTPGAPHGEEQKLRKVIPKVKPGSALDKDTKPAGPVSAAAEEQPPGYDAAGDLRFVKEQAEREAKAREVEKLKKEILAKAGPMPESADQEEVEEEAEKQAKKALRGDARWMENSPVMKGLDAYLKSQAGGSDPLLPSNCRSTAAYVAGFDPDSGEDADAIEPGVVYSIKPLEERARLAAWTAHYGAVIMTDGADHVTLENAGATQAEGFNKLQFDRTWFFEMYGPQQGQSFVEKYAKYF